MKIKGLLAEYTSLFSTILKILGLLLLCVILGSAVVYPLYLLATKFPAVYSWIVTAVIVLFVLIWIFIKIRQAGFSSTMRFIASFAIIAGAAAISVVLILNNHRLWAIPVIAAAVILWGFLRMVTKKQ